MNQQTFTQAFEQFANVAAPAKRANELFVNYLEQLTQIQLDAAKGYTNLAINELRHAQSITDAQSLQAYLAGQGEVAKTLGQKVSTDAQVIAKLNQDFATQAQKIAQEGVSVVSASAKKGAKAA